MNALNQLDSSFRSPSRGSSSSPGILLPLSSVTIVRRRHVAIFRRDLRRHFFRVDLSFVTIFPGDFFSPIRIG
jgi:hypothetical protein